jgi:hypothetical protein
MPKEFKGSIKLDVRDSTPDWDAFLAEKAPQAHRTCSSSSTTTPAAPPGPRTGGRIEMSTLQKFTPDTQGVVFAQGSRFGGHALFVKDGTLTYAYNFIGIPPETLISAPAPSTGVHIVGVEFTKERIGEHRESHGPLKLHIDEEVVSEEAIRR